MPTGIWQKPSIVSLSRQSLILLCISLEHPDICPYLESEADRFTLFISRELFVSTDSPQTLVRQ